MLGHAAFIRRKNIKSKCSDFSNTCHIRRKRVLIKNVTHFKMNRFPDLNFEYIVF